MSDLNESAPERKVGLAVYVGIFLISAAVLQAEIVLTRIFSALIWHHFAYMVISIAMLGSGAAGAWVAVFSPAGDDLYRRLVRLSAGFSIALLIGLTMTTRVRFDPFAIVSGTWNLAVLLIYCTSFFVAFFFAGNCIVRTITSLPEQVNKVYFSDLLGASVGSLSAVVILRWLGGPNAMVFSSFVAAAACFAFSLKAPSLYRTFATAFALVAASVVALVSVYNPIEVPSAFEFTFKQAGLQRLAHTEWDAINRIDVYQPRPQPLGAVGGLGPEFPGFRLYPQILVTQDALAPTCIWQSDGDLRSFSFLDYTVLSTPHQLVENPKTLVIGVGGGIDIITALYHGAPSVTGVELNPIMADLITNRYRDFVGDIFHRPEVKIIVDEGRSFVSRTDETFDIIQLTGVDTFAALTSGAYALSENYLYTKEAFEDFYRVLKPGGWLSMVRWLFDPPRETLKLCSVGLAALEDLGVENPENHIVVVSSPDGTWADFLMKKGEVTREDVAKIESFVQTLDSEILYSPFTEKVDPSSAAHVFTSYMRSDDKEAYRSRYEFAISAPTDDKPFFFHFYKLGRTGLSLKPLGKGGYLPTQLPLGYLILFASGAQIVMLMSLFILLPLYKFRRSGLAAAGRYRFLGYFLALGMGFIFVELVLMQRLTLFLGHPIYSITVVLFSLLLFSGLGSFTARRWEPRLGVIVPVMGVLVLLLLIYCFAMSPLLGKLWGQEKIVRAMVVVALIAPLGFLMGIPFPLGIRVVNRYAPQLIPWVWGVNACASVLSSVLCVLMCMTAGFMAAQVTAALVYLAGLLLMARILAGQRRKLEVPAS